MEQIVRPCAFIFLTSLSCSLSLSKEYSFFLLDDQLSKNSDYTDTTTKQLKNRKSRNPFVLEKLLFLYFTEGDRWHQKNLQYSLGFNSTKMAAWFRQISNRFVNFGGSLYSFPGLFPSVLLPSKSMRIGDHKERLDVVLQCCFIPGWEMKYCHET